MAVFIRVRGRAALLVCAAVAAALVGRCVLSADAPRETARHGVAVPGAGARGAARVADLLARVEAARRHPHDWLTGSLPLVRVEGEVVLDGDPVAGIDVRLATLPGSIEVTATRTDENGRFDLGLQPALAIHVVARGSDRRGVGTIDLGDHIASGQAWLIVNLEPCGHRVTGRLVDRGGRPLAGVPLHERFDTGWMGTVEAGRSGADGRFAVCAEEDVIAGGGSLGQVEVRFEEAILAPPFTVRGQVIRPDGTAVEAAIVDVFSFENGSELMVRTGRSGEWSAEMASGCVTLRARHRGQCGKVSEPGEPDGCDDGRPLEICGEPGSTVVAPPIVLEHCTGTTRGVVGVNGKPAAGLVVAIGEQRDLTDSLGRFSFDCAVGELRVPGHGIPAMSELDGSDRVLDIDATPLPWIRGVVKLSGRPIHGAKVRITGDDLDGEVAAVTARDGSYAVQVDSRGVCVTAEGPDGVTTPPPDRCIDLPFGSPGARVDLEMGDPTAIQGWARTADGTTLAGVPLLLFHTATSPIPVAVSRSSARGFFQMAPPPGAYFLEVARGAWRLAYGRARIPVAVPDDRTVELDIRVAPASE
jgi:hypothetical protein